MVSIAAFQAVDPGSIPGRRICLHFFPDSKKAEPTVTWMIVHHVYYAVKECKRTSGALKLDHFKVFLVGRMAEALSCGVDLMVIPGLDVTIVDAVSDSDTEDSLDISFTTDEDSGPEIDWSSNEDVDDCL